MKRWAHYPGGPYPAHYLPLYIGVSWNPAMSFVYVLSVVALRHSG